MKQVLLPTQFSELTPLGKKFISAWKEIKGYPQDNTMTLGECVEFLIAITFEFRRDDFLHGTFNNTLTLPEFQIGWDGEELIDILWFHITHLIAKRLSQTFNEPVNLPLDKSS